MSLLSHPPTRLLLLRSTLLQPSRSFSLLPTSHLSSPFPSPSTHPSSSSSPSHRSFATPSPSSAPPNTPTSTTLGTGGKAVEELKHENAKLFSKADTLSYRDLLRIFSETITKAFNTPFVPPKTSAKNIGDYTESLKRPGLKIMEDPGTFVMVERIRDAGQAEGMEMEAINQHILSILDTIAPPPEDAGMDIEQRKIEAEEELKEAVEKVALFKKENASFLRSKSQWNLNTYLPFSLGDKLNTRAVLNRNNNDVRILRLMARIMDCGYQAGRDPKEMSLLLKHGYFPANQPPAHAIGPDGKTVISAGEEEKYRGPPEVQRRGWPENGR
ncbi:hypothetical protein BDY24DRAFT_388984 [Mrakia frigida]|uniref:uncharacterized protein n=1 Tax=Mrakia frigida TaxID=29902 RepID=UPI003FCBEF0F